MNTNNTPSSYYKGSQSNYSGDDQEVEDHEGEGEADCEDLGYFDIITDSETLDFLDYYFKSTPTFIPITDFCTHLCTEYSDLLHQSCLSPADLSEELADKLEKSNGEISFNKLQVYTQEIGLTAYVENVCKELRHRVEKEEKEQLTKDVFLQLAELNEELKAKDTELKQREARLARAEQQLELRQQQVSRGLEEGKSRLEDEAVRLAKKAESEIKKQVTVVQKRLAAVERDVRNKAKIVMEKSKGHNTSLNMSMKSSKGDDQKKDIDKWKARVKNLESSYEVMKTK